MPSKQQVGDHHYTELLHLFPEQFGVCVSRPMCKPQIKLAGKKQKRKKKENMCRKQDGKKLLTAIVIFCAMILEDS